MIKKKTKINKILNNIIRENKQKEFPSELTKLNLTPEMYWWKKDNISSDEKIYKSKWGFYYSENYCIFMWIALNLYPRLIEFKKNLIGCPNNLTEEEWKEKLDKMILAFKIIIEDEQKVNLDTGKNTLSSKGNVTFEEVNGYHYMNFDNYKSFINNIDVTTDEYKQYQKDRQDKIKEGLQIFIDNFFNLWD